MLMAFCFHLLHCTVVIGPWLPLSLGWRPRPSGAAVAFGFLFLHACVALSLNHLAGTNYLFLNLPVAGTPLAALGGGSHGAYVASLGAMAAARKIAALSCAEISRSSKTRTDLRASS